MASLQVTADNSVIISEKLAKIVTKINNGNGTLWRLIEDSTIAQNISQTIVSLEKSSKGLNENMNAAKENFLLKGYFKRQSKAAQKIVDDAEEKKADEQKIINIDQLAQIKRIASVKDAEKCAKAVENVYDAQRRLEANVNEKLIFERLLLKLATSDTMKV